MTSSEGMGRPHAGLRLIAQTLFVLVVAALAVLPVAGPKPTARQLREQLLVELRPVVLENCTMRRFGSVNDGGYLMCENLLGQVESAYSYGIGPADDWGCDISQTRGVTVHQYDCFSPPVAGCPSGRSVFHDECIGPKRDTIDSRPFDSLTRQIARNGDAGKTLVVKIDVEGAELGSLLATSDRVLNHIDQMAMEIHGANGNFLELVRKLKRTFYLVHLHYNNQACSPRYRPLPAWAYQVLLVNKRLAVLDRANPAPALPNVLDAPDYAMGHDCQFPEPLDP